MRVIAIGDSFTVGLGTDREYEESQLGGHPSWAWLTDEERGERRKVVEAFRINNSYPKFFANLLGVDFVNLGQSGCGNQHIITELVSGDYKVDKGNASKNKIKENDIVLIGFTSSHRDGFPFLPKPLFDSTMTAVNKTAFKEKKFMDDKSLGGYYSKFGKWFSEKYSKEWIASLYVDEYYQYFNKNILYFAQQYCEYKKVKYIFFDAFEPMLTTPWSKIDTTKYWNFGSTLGDWLDIQNDKSLKEPRDKIIPDYNNLHPSKKGHQLFAHELYRFYNKVYNG